MVFYPNKNVRGFLRILLSIGVILTITIVSSSNDRMQQHAAMRWDQVAIEGIKGARFAAPMAARAAATIHTCMYDAWAAYDEHAVGTQLRAALRRPASERTEANKERAISYAAYHALTDLFPADTESVFKPLMRQLGFDPTDNSTDIETPTGIGNVACAAVLEFRHHDKSNQLGDIPLIEAARMKPNAIGPYSDWTGYTPINPPATVPLRFPFTKPINPDHWQPLTYTDSNGSLVVQMFSGAQWPFITPFALSSPDEFREALTSCPPASQGVAASEPALSLQKGPISSASKLGASAAAFQGVGPLGPTLSSKQRGALAPEETPSSPCQQGPAKFGSPEYQQQADSLLALSANLSDRQKMLAEYWSDDPDSESPVVRWMRFAEFISERDHHSLDDDVKMFLALSNALLDASVASWDAKRSYDSVRPITAIAFLYQGKSIRGWGGSGKGTIEMDGAKWCPYQLSTYPSPPTPEYVSETSAFSAAAAQILQLSTASDRFGYSVTIPAGSSKIEPAHTPAAPLTLKWDTLTQAADDAGMSGRYGGIQFERGDLIGRKLGKLAADGAWEKVQVYFSGSLKADAH